MQRPTHAVSADQSSERDATHIEEERERDATELASYEPERRRTQPNTSEHRSEEPHWWRIEPLKKFWMHYVQLILPHDTCRDHLCESSYVKYVGRSETTDVE